MPYPLLEMSRIAFLVFCLCSALVAGAAAQDNNAGPSGKGITAAAILEKNLTATGGSQRVTLNWVNHATTATGIAIERKQNPNQPFTQIATVAPASTTYVDTSAKKRTTYYYRIRTMNGTLVSPYSNTASATTLP